MGGRHFESPPVANTILFRREKCLGTRDDGRNLLRRWGPGEFFLRCPFRPAGEPSAFHLQDWLRLGSSTSQFALQWSCCHLPPLLEPRRASNRALSPEYPAADP